MSEEIESEEFRSDAFEAAPERLDDAAWLGWASTRAVFAALAADGHETRAVGGVVRDTLLGLPAGDVDLATTLAPEVVMERSEAAGLKAIGTGLAHGTVTVVANEKPFEVTTLRADVETDGRHAKVAFIDDWEADASRRDFTMNALYASAGGTLHDPLGGYGDIMARRVRFIGDPDARIAEDYLRTLRFFRFNAEHGEPPYDEDAIAACARNRASLAGLSRERVSAELLKLLGGPGAADALGAMFDHGLLTAVVPGAPRLSRLAHLMALEDRLARDPDPLLRLAALAFKVREDAARLETALRLSRAQTARLRKAGDALPDVAAADEAGVRIALHRHGVPACRDALLLAWAEAGHAHDERFETLIELAGEWTPPAFPVSGVDLTSMGIAPGPALGDLLRRLESDWIASDFGLSRTVLLARARDLMGKGDDDD